MDAQGDAWRVGMTFATLASFEFFVGSHGTPPIRRYGEGDHSPDARALQWASVGSFFEPTVA
jgi:hypothetical protein